MALVSLGEFELFPVINNSGTVVSTRTLDASGEKLAFVFQVPKSGNITKLGFRTSTVTVTDTLKISLQTIDSSGNPTGTLYGGSAVVTQATPASNTWYEVTLGTQATAVQADYVAMVIEFNSYVAGNLQFTIGGAGPKFPYLAQFDAGAWTHPAGLAYMTVGYDDGSYPFTHNWPVTALNTVAFNSGSTPDERGLKFSVPFRCRISGVLAYVATTAGGDFDVVLYDTDGTTVLKTVTTDGDVLGATAVNRVLCHFATGQILEPNVFYRVTVKPTTANNVSTHEIAVNTAAYMDILPGGQNVHLTTRTDAGAWTDTTTTRMRMGLIFNQAEDLVAIAYS